MAPPPIAFVQMLDICQVLRIVNEYISSVESKKFIFTVVGVIAELACSNTRRGEQFLQRAAAVSISLSIFLGLYLIRSS